MIFTAGFGSAQAVTTNKNNTTSNVILDTRLYSLQQCNTIYLLKSLGSIVSFLCCLYLNILLCTSLNSVDNNKKERHHCSILITAQAAAGSGASPRCCRSFSPSTSRCSRPPPPPAARRACSRATPICARTGSLLSGEKCTFNELLNFFSSFRNIKLC